MIGWRVGWVAGPADTVTDAGWARLQHNDAGGDLPLRGYGSPARRPRPCRRVRCRTRAPPRHDTLSLPGWPFVSPAGAGRFFSTSPRWASSQRRPRILLDDAKIAATAMTGWGDEIAARYVRFVFSAEPVDRLETIPDRVDGTKLARPLRVESESQAVIVQIARRRPGRSPKRIPRPGQSPYWSAQNDIEYPSGRSRGIGGRRRS